jgi:urease accessory protein UreF
MAAKEQVNVPVAVVTFWESGVGKSFRAFLYVAVSSLIASAIAALTHKDAATAAVLTPLVNTVLVLLKGVLTPTTQTLPGVRR